MNIELRILKRISHNTRSSHVEVLQQRMKTKWIDGSADGDGYYAWGNWEDVPMVHEYFEYKEGDL